MTTSDASQTELDKASIWQQLDSEDTGKVTPVTKAAATDAANPAAADAAAKDQAATDQHTSPADTSAAPAAQADASAAAQSGSQELIDKVSGLQSIVDSLTGRLRSAEGRIGELNGKLKDQLAAGQAATARGAAAPSAEQIRAAQGSAQAMDALKKDYPEFGEALSAVLEEQRAETQRLLEQSRPTGVAGVTSADLDGLRTEVQIEVQHPGWRSRVKTPEFHGWLQRQPIEVRELANSEDPAHAVRLLDLHRDSTKAAPQNTIQQRLETAAAIPTGRSGSAPKTKPVAEMSKDEYWRYLDEQERAQAQR